MDQLQYHFPFAKVDQQRRIVSGFATLNNLDLQKDIVETDASVKAFKSFRGNIREQHSRVAAGKMLSFGIEQFFDKVANKVYDGIFVRAYISKGAPDTWEKVLDGTLNGFSVGGDITDFENQIDEDGNVVRVIKEYTLSELSLVDNPANQFANIVSIEKAHDFFAKMAEDIEDKELDNMEEAGTIVAEPVVAATEPQPVATEPAEKSTESDVVDDTAIEAVTEPVVEEEPAHEAVAESNDSEVLSNAINELKALLEDRDNKTNTAFQAIVDQLKELRTGVETANTNTSNMAGELASVKSTVSEFDKRIHSVEKGTAVRKSVDLGEVDQVSNTTDVEKSIWGGRFLTADQ